MKSFKTNVKKVLYEFHQDGKSSEYCADKIELIVREAIINAYIQSQQDLSLINYGKKLTSGDLACVKIEAINYYDNL
jgi:hypothetical protein